jgi:hypothetical protein
MPGSDERDFVSLTDLQKSIINSKEFDLLDERINPMTPGLS